MKAVIDEWGMAVRGALSPSGRICEIVNSVGQGNLQLSGKGREKSGNFRNLLAVATIHLY